MTKKRGTIVSGAFGQVIDKGFDLLSAGIVKGRSPAVIGGIRFHQRGIELMLTNQKAEAISKSWRGGMAVAIIFAAVRSIAV